MIVLQCAMYAVACMAHRARRPVLALTVLVSGVTVDPFTFGAIVLAALFFGGAPRLALDWFA